MFRETLELVSLAFNTYYNCSLVAMFLVVFIVVVVISFVVVVRLVAISNAASKFFSLLQLFCSCFCYLLGEELL